LRTTPNTTHPAPIVFALDFERRADALEAAREVAPAIGMVKIGLELFVSHGPGVVSIGREVSEANGVGLPVFLDLKLHDIPETVERAVAQAAKLGARVVTVHASGGRTMLRRAALRAKDTGLDICAVTVLTSLDDGDLNDIGVHITPSAHDSSRSLASLAAERLACMAWEQGVRWFVCSPAEVRVLRTVLGREAVLVTPGVRPAATGKGGKAERNDDQKRVATAEQAIRDGASWIVVGRPIRDAKNRLAAAREIAEAIARVTRVSPA